MRPGQRRVLVLATAVLLAGCVGPTSEPAADASPRAPADDEAAPQGANATAGAADARPASNATTPPSRAPAWPAIDDALVRPGAQITYWGPPALPARPFSGCTSNFLFRSPDNASLFLGTAAHCVDGLAVGDPVAIEKGLANGTLAYSSWIIHDAGDAPEGVAREANDFALVRIDDAHRGIVHPAVLHYGGPVALADLSTVAPGESVLVYGNSDFRQKTKPTDQHEGCVVSVDAWTLRAFLGNPAIPADSGSPVLTADGEALAVLIHLSGASAVTGTTVSTNGALPLATALAFARNTAGIDVELVTWPLLAGGVMPAPPTC